LFVLVEKLKISRKKRFVFLTFKNFFDKMARIWIRRCELRIRIRKATYLTTDHPNPQLVICVLAGLADIKTSDVRVDSAIQYCTHMLAEISGWNFES
jgi:hypothetical protein